MVVLIVNVFKVVRFFEKKLNISVYFCNLNDYLVGWFKSYNVFLSKNG